MNIRGRYHTLEKIMLSRLHTLTGPRLGTQPGPHGLYMSGSSAGGGGNGSAAGTRSTGSHSHVSGTTPAARTQRHWWHAGFTADAAGRERGGVQKALAQLFTEVPDMNVADYPALFRMSLRYTIPGSGYGPLRETSHSIAEAVLQHAPFEMRSSTFEPELLRSLGSTLRAQKSTQYHTSILRTLMTDYDLSDQSRLLSATYGELRGALQEYTADDRWKYDVDHGPLDMLHTLAHGDHSFTAKHFAFAAAFSSRSPELQGVLQQQQWPLGHVYALALLSEPYTHTRGYHIALAATITAGHSQGATPDKMLEQIARTTLFQKDPTKALLHTAPLTAAFAEAFGDTRVAHFTNAQHLLRRTTRGYRSFAPRMRAAHTALISAGYSSDQTRQLLDVSMLRGSRPSGVISAAWHTLPQTVTRLGELGWSQEQSTRTMFRAMRQKRHHPKAELEALMATATFLGQQRGWSIEQVQGAHGPKSTFRDLDRFVRYLREQGVEDADIDVTIAALIPRMDAFPANDMVDTSTYYISWDDEFWSTAQYNIKAQFQNGLNFSAAAQRALSVTIPTEPGDRY